MFIVLCFRSADFLKRVFKGGVFLVLVFFLVGYFRGCRWCGCLGCVFRFYCNFIESCGVLWRVLVTLYFGILGIFLRLGLVRSKIVLFWGLGLGLREV